MGNLEESKDSKESKYSIINDSKKRGILFLTILFIAMIIIAAISKLTVKELCEGMVISLCASLVFFIYTILVDNSSNKIKTDLNVLKRRMASLNSSDNRRLQKIDTEISSISMKLKENTEIIEEQKSLLQKVVDHNAETALLKEQYGILEIVKREEYSYEFWKNLLKKARDESNDQLVLTGRTLGRWMIPTIKKDFISTLVDLANKSIKIRFVIYRDFIPGSQEDKEKKELYSILNSHVFPVLKRKYNTYEEASKRFEIIEIDSLPYLFNAIKDEIVVGQYFKYAENTTILMFVLDSKRPFATRYVTDLEEMIKENGVLNTWLKEYYEKDGAHT